MILNDILFLRQDNSHVVEEVFGFFFVLIQHYGESAKPVGTKSAMLILVRFYFLNVSFLFSGVDAFCSAYAGHPFVYV